MPRRNAVSRRPITPDPVYGSQLVAKFVNQLMTGGKKSIAEGILYGAFDIIKTRTKRDALDVFEKAMEHIRPFVEVKSRRVGGATYQVPIEVHAARATALAMRWLVEYAKKRGEKGMLAKIAGEIMDAADEEGGSKGKGGAVKKREDTHRMAEANKAFSHYRW
jgi:small subunit ribosomal protein S7